MAKVRSPKTVPFSRYFCFWNVYGVCVYIESMILAQVVITGNASSTSKHEMGGVIAVHIYEAIIISVGSFCI